MSASLANFLSFLSELERGEFNSDSWKNNAIRHYTEEPIESARIELVKSFIDYMTLESQETTIPESVIVKVTAIKNELKRKYC